MVIKKSDIFNKPYSKKKKKLKKKKKIKKKESHPTLFRLPIPIHFLVINCIKRNQPGRGGGAGT